MSRLILNRKIKENTRRMYISIPKNKEGVVDPLWKLGTEVFATLPDGTYLLNGIVEPQKDTMWWFKIPAGIRHEFGLEKGDDVLVYVEGEHMDLSTIELHEAVLIRSIREHRCKGCSVLVNVEADDENVYSVHWSDMVADDE